MIPGLAELRGYRRARLAGDLLAGVARVKQDLLARPQAFGLADKIGTELLFPTLPTAVQPFRDRGGAEGTKGPGSGNQRP